MTTTPQPRRWRAPEPVGRWWTDPVTTVVAVATVVSFVARVALARSVVGPFMYSDELGYVAVGRALIGEAPALFGPDYAPGYGVALAPPAAVLEPGRLHGVAQVLNAAAGAALIPVLYLLATRVAALPRWLAAAASVVAASGAALVVQSTMLLPEALFALAAIDTVDGWSEPASAHWAATHDLGPLLDALDEPVAIDVTDPELALYACNLQYWHPEVDLALGADPEPPAALLIARAGDAPDGAEVTLVGVEAGADLGPWALDAEVPARALAGG